MQLTQQCDKHAAQVGGRQLKRSQIHFISVIADDHGGLTTASRSLCGPCGYERLRKIHLAQQGDLRPAGEQTGTRLGDDDPQSLCLSLKREPPPSVSIGPL